MESNNVNSNNKVLLIDGMALLFRGYYANAYGGYIRKTAAGLPTNAVYGFLKYFFDALTNFKPTHVICCWDMGRQTFRSEKFANYKFNRPEAPLDLIPQFDLVKEVVSSFSVPNIGLINFEADDCIGTLARQFSKIMNVNILTGDHDLLQLVSDKVEVILLKKGPSNYAVYCPGTLFTDKQLTAKQFIDLKGLIGDTSDNYPGVRGIGPKIATKLLQEYDSIEGILANMEFLPKGVRDKIEADLEMLHLCRELATIKCDVPIHCPMEDSRWSPDYEIVKRKLIELEFKSLLRELPTNEVIS